MHFVEILSNVDKIEIKDKSAWDIAYTAATELIEKGYPLLYTDAHSLANAMMETKGKPNANVQQEIHNG